MAQAAKRSQVLLAGGSENILGQVGGGREKSLERRCAALSPPCGGESIFLHLGGAVSRLNAWKMQERGMSYERQCGPAALLPAGAPLLRFLGT